MLSSSAESSAPEIQRRPTACFALSGQRSPAGLSVTEFPRLCPRGSVYRCPTGLREVHRWRISLWARMLRAGGLVEFAEFGCHVAAGVARVHSADRLDE